MDNVSYFDRLHHSVTRIARHAFYPGKEEAVEQCLEEIEHLRDCGQISGQQLAILREVLIGDENVCLLEGVARERERPEAASAPGHGGIALYAEGVGSHAAFSAGVLQGLLGTWDRPGQIHAVGGCDDGAVNALLAWEGLLRGDLHRSVAQIQTYWEHTATHCWLDLLLNHSTQMLHHLRAVVPLLGMDLPLRVLMDHHSPRVSLENLLDYGVVDALAAIEGAPRLVVGTTGSETDRAATVRALTASKPAEIWLIRIRRDGQAEDRQLDLELGFIHKLNELIASGSLVDRRYRRIEVHQIIMDHDLDEASKVDRSPGFIDRLMVYGRERAKQFLEKRSEYRSRRDATLPLSR